MLKPLKGLATCPGIPEPWLERSFGWGQSILSAHSRPLEGTGCLLIKELRGKIEFCLQCMYLVFWGGGRTKAKRKQLTRGKGWWLPIACQRSHAGHSVDSIWKEEFVNENEAFRSPCFHHFGNYFRRRKKKNHMLKHVVEGVQQNQGLQHAELLLQVLTLCCTIFQGLIILDRSALVLGDVSKPMVARIEDPKKKFTC